MFSLLGAQERLCDRVSEDKGTGFFFSEFCFNDMCKIFSDYRGHEGLPGTFPSNVAVNITRGLQAGLYPLATRFADEVCDAATDWTLERTTNVLVSSGVFIQWSSKSYRERLAKQGKSCKSTWTFRKSSSIKWFLKITTAPFSSRTLKNRFRKFWMGQRTASELSRPVFFDILTTIKGKERHRRQQIFRILEQLLR